MSLASKIIPESLKGPLRVLRDFFVRGENISHSKHKWDRLAKENARYYVMTDHGENISENKFCG